MSGSWTTESLLSELSRYEQDLKSAGMTEQTVKTYVDRARRFIRWLDGDYQPQVGN